jgi:Fe-S cluster assembly protein SufB
MSSTVNTIRDLAEREYKWGFVTDIEEERVPKGLNEETVRLISAKKNEPEFMLQWRLKAYRYWAAQEQKQAEPTWANIKYPPIDYQAITYYSAPKQKPSLTSLDELDPEILRTYEKLGIPLAEQKMLAASRLTRSSTVSLSLRLSRRSSPKWASFFVPSPKRYRNIPT